MRDIQEAFMTNRILRVSLTVALVGAIAAATSVAGAAGRYKKEGKLCVWDAKDSGPNQCEPVAAGRFKKEGDKCQWVAGDSGPDQCKPAKGRFKKEGNRCEWNASDSGPNQCDPRDAK